MPALTSLLAAGLTTQPALSLAPEDHALRIFGVKLIGVTYENATKLLLTVILIAAAVLISRLARTLIRGLRSRKHERVGFWARQGLSVFLLVIVIIGVVSIWFDDPTRLSTALGLVTAGLAFALQRAVTAFAGYLVILRGNTFSVGDRITMGGVRGDVIALGFMQTTIMEMGQPPAVQAADPAMWVRSRQYTGRIVTVTNDKIFDEPVYNYTRDFDYIWEEISLPIAYRDDRHAAERILQDAVVKHTIDFTHMAEPEIRRLEVLHKMPRDELRPRVFWRLTDNWLEMTARFLVPTHGVRRIKDQISRDLLEGLDKANIGIASATFEIVGVPPLEVRRAAPAQRDRTS